MITKNFDMERLNKEYESILKKIFNTMVLNGIAALVGFSVGLILWFLTTNFFLTVFNLILGIVNFCMMLHEWKRFREFKQAYVDISTYLENVSCR